MQSPLHEMRHAQTIREIIFMALAVLVALSDAAIAALVTDTTKLAAITIPLSLLFFALLFCRFRASNCANAINIAIYFEGTDVKAAHRALRLSDCIKNADAFVGMLARSTAARSRKTNQKNSSSH